MSMYSTVSTSLSSSLFSSTRNPRKVGPFSIPYPRLRLLPRIHVLRPATGRTTVTICAGNNPSIRKPPPDRNLLKAKDIVRDHLCSLSTNSIELDDVAELGQLLPDQAVGLVAAAQANFMRVIVEFAGGREGDGEGAGIGGDSRVGMELLCVVRGLLKKMKRRVLVGDKVLVKSVDWVDGRGMIENTFSRRTEITDPPVANVDHLVVMFSIDQPKLEPFWLTRFLVEAETTGIPFTLVLNKIELVSDKMISSWESRLHDWGYTPIFCSVEKKDGLKQLEDILKLKTTVIVGPSGVGKSSLINAMRENSINNKHEDDGCVLENYEGKKWDEYQRVGTVSKRSGRGKHTTRHVSLLSLPEGGLLADTPGFNQPLLLKAKKKTLAETFPEIRNKLNASESSTCSFNDCLHLREPGCVVKGDWERYPYYLQLLNEIKVREEFQLRTFGTKRESDVRYKNRDLGVIKAEPRLDLKKHRRISRKQTNQSMPYDHDS